VIRLFVLEGDGYRETTRSAVLPALDVELLASFSIARRSPRPCMTFALRSPPVAVDEPVRPPEPGSVAPPTPQSQRSAPWAGRLPICLRQGART
jgi:hypothetical protein